MMKTIENDILFDDVQVLETNMGKPFLTSSGENHGKDGNCSSYTHIQPDEEFSAA